MSSFFKNNEAMRHLLVLCGYLVIALIFTWPVALHFTTHIPGGGDAPWFLWQFWWFKYALLDLRQLPYQTGMIFYPLTDVPVMAQTPVNEVLMLPLLLGTNLIIFNNLLFLLSYVLSGYFTYLLGRGLGCRREIAFMGGIIFAFCAYRGMRGLGHMSLLTTQWMPLALLLAIQCWRNPSIQRGIALGTITALVALSSPYYIGLFLFPVLITGGIYLLVAQWSTLWRRDLWAMAVAAIGVAALFIIPAYLHYLFLETEIYAVNDALAAEAATYSADVLSWLLPPGMNALWRSYTGPIYARFSTPNLMETSLFVGYLPLVLWFVSIFLSRRRPSLRFWQLLALVSLLLSLGPILHFQGISLVDGLPYRWLLEVPGFSSFRVPSRAGITVALALSVISMVTLQTLSTYRYPLWRWGLGGLSLLYLANVSPLFPHPLTDATIPELYEELAASEEQFALLELPGGEYMNNNYNFFGAASQWMYYQSVHHRPTISGYLGRRPPRLHEPERTLPFVRRFFSDGPQLTAVDFPDLTWLPEPYWPTEIDNAAALLMQEGIGAVVLHCNSPYLQQFCLAATSLLNQGLGMVDTTTPTMQPFHRLYRVKTPTYQSQQLPQYFTELTPHYDETFVATYDTPYHRSYELHGEQGIIHFAIPFNGRWRIQGVLSGAWANESQVLIDTQQVSLQPDASMGMGYLWHTEIALQAGQHQITIQAPTSISLYKIETEPCRDLCIHNVSVHLQALAQPGMSNSTTFVNTRGEQSTLLKHRLLLSTNSGINLVVTPDSTTSNDFAAWFMTAWTLDPSLSARLSEPTTAMPNIFVHLFDANGQMVSQADHPLGERYLFDGETSTLYDFVPLARDLSAAIDLATVRIEMGLWYPENGDYFWQPIAADQRTAHIFSTTLFAQQPLSFYLPQFFFALNENRSFCWGSNSASHCNRSIALTPSFLTQFTSPGAESKEPYLLLNAALSPPLAQSALSQKRPDLDPWHLITTWQAPYNFRPSAQTVIDVYLTNAIGEQVSSFRYQLGGYDLLGDTGGVIIDRVPMPMIDGDLDTLIVSFELWNTDTQEYYTPTPLHNTLTRNDSTATDAKRLSLGNWSQLRVDHLSR